MEWKPIRRPALVTKPVQVRQVVKWPPLERPAPARLPKELQCLDGVVAALEKPVVAMPH